MQTMPPEVEDNVPGTSCDSIAPTVHCFGPFAIGGWTGAEARTLHDLDSKDYGKWRRLWRDCQEWGYVRVNTKLEFERLTRGPCQSTQQEYIDGGFLWNGSSRDWSVYDEGEVGYADHTFDAFRNSDTCTDAAWGRERHNAGCELECEGQPPTLYGPRRRGVVDQHLQGDGLGQVV